MSQSRGVLILTVVCLLISFVLISGSVALADGQGDDWPSSSPPDTSTSDEVSLDGIRAAVAFNTLMQLIL